MSEELNQPIYSKSAIEFVAVSNEYCRFVEQAGSLSTKDLLSRGQKLLSLLYLKTSLLPEHSEGEEDSYLEQFVTEVEYAYLQNRIANLLGRFDYYQEVPSMEEQHTEVTAWTSISESLLDIYQALKDFTMNYRTADGEVMQAALVECLFQFRYHWGQQLVNVLRPIHQLLYSGVDLEQGEALKSGEGAEE